MILCPFVSTQIAQYQLVTEGEKVGHFFVASMHFAYGSYVMLLSIKSVFWMLCETVL